jgi:hypothetical protein
MKKFRLMIELNMPIHELIEMIKLRGKVVELNDSIFGIQNDKYVERVILFFNNVFWVTYAIYDNYNEQCYWEDLQDFISENQARIYYNDLINSLNYNE